jgi:hypothetical protein
MLYSGKLCAQQLAEAAVAGKIKPRQQSSSTAAAASTPAAVTA